MNIWSRLGLSVAAAAIFCIAVMELFQDKTYYQLLKWYAAAILGVVGLATAFTGWRLWVRGRRLVGAPVQTSSEYADGESGPLPPELRLASHLAFWGPILVIYGAIIFFIPYKDKTAQPVAARVATPEKPAEKPVEPPSPIKEVVVPKPLTFPDLKIQGMVFRPPNSAIIINGKSFFVGDAIENAEIVAIDSNTVTLELNGQRKIVMIDKALPLQKRGSAPMTN
jgi:hypothetical protein